MSMTGQKWEQLYNVAVLESDWTTAKIDERIEAAEAAIKGRLHEFSLNHGGTPEENQAIIDVANRLANLREEVKAWRSSTRVS
jgi:hypothetical protein